MDIKTKTERQTKEMVKETVFKERAQKVLTSMKENGMDHAEKMRRFRLIAVQEKVMKCEMGK